MSLVYKKTAKLISISGLHQIYNPRIKCTVNKTGKIDFKDIATRNRVHFGQWYSR